IAVGPASAEQPALASDGAGYLLAYRQGGGTEVKAHPLTADGAPAGDATSLGQSASTPLVASRGADYLASWVDSTTGNLRYARVGADGRVLGGVWNVAAGSSPVNAALAWTGVSYFR